MADVIAIDISLIPEAEAKCLASSTFDMLQRILSTKEGRDALNKKKKELAERTIKQ